MVYPISGNNTKGTLSFPNRKRSYMIDFDTSSGKGVLDLYDEEDNYKGRFPITKKDLDDEIYGVTLGVDLSKTYKR